jgi:phytanoyl-CoA hydroxylase
VRCFFEEEAFDADGQLKQAKALSINKIGHAMHDLDPVFEAFTRDAKLAAVARDLGLAQPQVWQSMYIFKQPGIGGEVRWHQDATFFDSTPISVTTFWFALEDATIDNGCLWVEPGGHRGPLRERFLRDGDRITMEKLDRRPGRMTAPPCRWKPGPAAWCASMACCRITARRTGPGVAACVHLACDGCADRVFGAELDPAGCGLSGARLRIR